MCTCTHRQQKNMETQHTEIEYIYTDHTAYAPYIQKMHSTQKTNTLATHTERHTDHIPHIQQMHCAQRQHIPYK